MLDVLGELVTAYFLLGGLVCQWVLTVFRTALRAAPHISEGEVSPGLGAVRAPAPSAALGLLSPADLLHKEQRWNLHFASGFPFPPKLTRVTTQILSLLNGYKLITKPFASLDKVFYYINTTAVA